MGGFLKLVGCPASLARLKIANFMFCFSRCNHLAAVVLLFGSRHVRKSLLVSVPVAPCNAFAMLIRVLRYCGAVLEQRWDPAAVVYV